MPRRSLLAKTSAACSASAFETPKCMNTREEKFRKQAVGKICVTLSSVGWLISNQANYGPPRLSMSGSGTLEVLPCEIGLRSEGFQDRRLEVVLPVGHSGGGRSFASPR